MEPRRSFRLHSFSRRVGRSNSCLLQSELARSADFGVIPGYQRLSESMRLTDELDVYNDLRGNNKLGVVGFLGRVFSFRRERWNESEEGKTEMSAKKKKKKKKKKRWSWLPDPDRRWPVQGW